MTLLFMDGFDDLASISEVEKKWDVYTQGTYPHEVQLTGGRFGGGCVRGRSANGYIQKSITPTLEVVVGFALKFDGGAYEYNQGLLNLLSSSVNLEMLSTGHLQYAFLGATRAVSDYFMKPDTWYYVEVKLIIDNSVGEFHVRVNGIPWISMTNHDTNLSTDICTGIRLRGSEHSSYYFYFDDVYILDTQGTKNNDFLGDVRVVQLKPTGAGNYAQFTPSAGNNYECVDDSNWSGSDYVESGTTDQIDTHTFEALPSGLGAVKGVQLVNGSRKLIQSDATQMKHIVRKSSTDYASPARELSDNIYGATEIWEEDPEDSADWTKAKIDATEFGYQSVIP